MMLAQWCVLALATGAKTIGLTPEEIAENNMTPAGWCVMIVSITSVLLMLVYSLYKTLSLPPVDEISDAELAQTTINPDTDL